MLLNKKGFEGKGIGWLGSTGLIVILIIAYLVIFHMGIFGDVKKAFGKTLGTKEEWKEITEEHFGDEETMSEEIRMAGRIRDLIKNTFNKVKEENCIGYIDLSKIDGDISDYSIYFRESEFYIYKGTIKDYTELLTGDALAFGNINVDLVSRVERDKEYGEFWLTDGLRRIYIKKESSESFTQDPITKVIIPKGGMVYYSLLSSHSIVRNPHFLYKNGKIILLAKVPLEDTLRVDPNVYDKLCFE